MIKPGNIIIQGTFKLEPSYSNVALYPMVGMKERGARIETNFGASPFRFNRKRLFMRREMPFVEIGRKGLQLGSGRRSPDFPSPPGKPIDPIQFPGTF